MLRLLLFLVIQIFSLTSAEESINVVASEIANTDFLYNSLTSVIWSGSTSEGVNEFTRSYKGQVLTARLKDINNRMESYQKAFSNVQIVLYVQKVEEFNTYLNTVYTLSTKPCRMILVVANPNQNITDFTRAAWQNDVSNIVVLNLNDRNETKIHTYTPFSNGKCGDYTPIPMKFSQRGWFNDKFGNFHRCSVLIEAYEIRPHVILNQANNDVMPGMRGIYVDYIETVLEKLNATLNIVPGDENRRTTTPSTVTSRGTSSNVSELPVSKTALLLPAIIINKERYERGQISHVFAFVEVVWCVPQRREIFSWAKIIIPFLSNITILIVMSFLLFIITMKFIYRFGTGDKSTNITLKSIAIFLGQEVKFNRRHWFVSNNYMMWIWYCFVVRIAYQCNLIRGLYDVILEPPIRSLADALKEFDEVVAGPTVEEVYRGTAFERRFNLINSENLPKYIHRLANGDRFLLGIWKSSISFNRLNVQILDERVSNFPICFFMKVRWAGAKTIDRVITRANECGLLAKTLRAYTDVWLRRGGHNFMEKSQQHGPLNMLTLNSLFYGLLISYLICSLIFCIEIVWHKFRNRTEVTKSKRVYF